MMDILSIDSQYFSPWVTHTPCLICLGVGAGGFCARLDNAFTGTVTGYLDAEKKYKIKLDEGTKITAALPDDDIEILGVPPPLAKELCKAASSRASVRGASKTRENFAFPPRLAEDASAGLDAIKEMTVVERTLRPRAGLVHYAGVKAAECAGLPGLWQAELALCGHVKDLGVYDTPEEAAAAYNRAVLWYRTVAAGSRVRDSGAGDTCELARALAELVLNPVDGVAYCKELHAPPQADQTAGDAGNDKDRGAYDEVGAPLRDGQTQARFGRRGEEGSKDGEEGAEAEDGDEGDGGDDLEQEAMHGGGEDGEAGVD